MYKIRTYKERLLSDGRVRCTRCRKGKGPSDFSRTKAGRYAPHCKLCRKMYGGEYRRSPEGLAARAAWKARPEVEARRREYEAARSKAQTGRIKAWRATPRGKLLSTRGNVLSRLRRIEDPARRARLLATVDNINAELARLDGPAIVDAEEETPCRSRRGPASRATKDPCQPWVGGVNVSTGPPPPHPWRARARPPGPARNN